MEYILKKEPRRSRAAQKAYRKQQLIDSTIHCIDRLGFSGTTLAQVATHAGVSQGIVIHHFTRKDILFLETLRYMTEEYRVAGVKALSAAGPDPVARLCAFVAVDYSRGVLSRKKVSVWYAFWGEAKSRPTYMQECGASDADHSEVLYRLCAALDDEGKAVVSPQVAALAIEGMTDSMWQRCLIAPADFDRKEAARAAFDLMEGLFPAHAGEIKRLRPA